MDEMQVRMTEKAINYMKENFEEDLTTEELARYVGYSPFHFTRVFKSVTGVTPRHFLSALRIEAGKHKIINSSSSGFEIHAERRFQKHGYIQHTIQKNSWTFTERLPR
ncbi:AraC family transcriptional regulator [Alkalihalobacillus sp. AL-G]|uniref:AraC family transcriptional regulator n=1 Tax=Alkalihalobacillus sp. AL-G TaxID=2926399 RepID=UPI00272CF8F2|nr:AraC family transcriptional regulator [Alkalihalobacillus sp. AL-G]WLD94665.1 AraC family transcriptional regulator [Alkalihalobacillus sp. AL-G]